MEKGLHREIDSTQLLEVTIQQLLMKKSLARESQTNCMNQKEDEGLVYHSHPYSTWKTEHIERRNVENDTNGDRVKYLCMKNYMPVPQKMPTLLENSGKLMFNSEYENGNLSKVYQLTSKEYVLVLKYDLGTQDYCHWFNFTVQSKQNDQCRFHIVNMMRPEPLVSEGMAPVVRTKHSTWAHDCELIEFRETAPGTLYLEPSSLQYFTYSFCYTFKSKSPVSVAYSYPYTYSDLNSYLSKISQKFPDSLQVHTLTTTLCQNECNYIILTDNISTYSFNKPHNRKKAIIVTSRIHPGESNTSFIIEGFIDLLLSSNSDAETLRKNFVFFIVPMLNPDGVRHGNYRCSALGVDLNRRWVNPHKTLHPTIYHTKELISTILELHEIAFYCDFHGHSKKKNAFMYGVFNSKKEAINQRGARISMVLPVLMAQLNRNFSYKDCHYRMDKSKQATARIALSKQFSIANSYTLECSMHGSDYKEAFDIADFKQLGQDLAVACKSLISYNNIKESLLNVENYLKSMRNRKQTAKPKKLPRRAASIEELGCESSLELGLRKTLHSHSKESSTHDRRKRQKLPGLFAPRDPLRCTGFLADPIAARKLPTVHSQFRFSGQRTFLIPIARPNN